MSRISLRAGSSKRSQRPLGEEHEQMGPGWRGRDVGQSVYWKTSLCNPSQRPAHAYHFTSNSKNSNQMLARSSLPLKEAKIFFHVHFPTSLFPQSPPLYSHPAPYPFSCKLLQTQQARNGRRKNIPISKDHGIPEPPTTVECFPRSNSLLLW